MQQTQSVTNRQNFCLMDNLVKNNIAEPMTKLMSGDEDQITRSAYIVAKGALATVSGWLGPWVGIEVGKAIAHEYTENESKVMRIASKVFISTADLGLLIYASSQRETVGMIKKKSSHGHAATSSEIPNPNDRSEEITPENVEERTGLLTFSKKVARSIYKHASFIEPFHIDGPVITTEDGETMHIDQYAEKHLEDINRENAIVITNEDGSEDVYH